MSDLLNQASLVMVPSGYKEDTVYSVVPTDGSGDLSFTRASNGTRVNSAGLVEVVPWNLNTNSNDFATGWVGANRALTVDATTAPNGTTTADQLGAIGGTAYYAKYITSPIGSYTFSVFLKYGNRQYQQIYGYAGTAYFAEATFDLQNGTVYSIQHGNASIENVGGGWYRCSIYGTTIGTSIEIGIESIAVSTYTYAWGAQLNIGSTAKPYFPTTDRLNVPRLTYQNGGGGCPSLLLEKQSTNLAIYSQQFNAGYTTYNGTTTDNFAIAPDGTQTAAKVETVSFNSATLRQTNGGLTNGQPYTLSLYIKQGSGITAFLDIGDTASTVNITPTNEWVRYTYTANWNTTLNFIDIELRGTNGSYCYIWGCQLEAGSYATSYIPTTSSSATRVADAMNVNLPNTNMTFCAYLECEEAPLGTTAGDWLYIYSSASNLGRAYGYANQFGFADAYSLGVVGGTKMVWKQESGTTAKVFKGGALVGTSTTGTYSNPFNRFTIDGNYLDKPLKIKEFVFFDNNLTDAECIALTI